MKKLMSIILIICLITALSLPTSADVITYRPEAVETLVARIKTNATSGNENPSWPSYRWKLDLPEMGDREIWLGFSSQPGKEDVGTLDVLIRTENAVYYLWQYRNLWQTTYVSYTDDTSLSDEFLSQMSQTNSFGALRSERQWITGSVQTQSYTAGTAPWRLLDSNIPDVKTSQAYADLTEEICWMVDAIQFVLEDAYPICSIGFYTLASNFTRLCRYHVWIDPTPIGAHNVHYVCARCGYGRIVHNSRFSDVPEDAWYSDAVDWAVAVGITDGTTDSTFSPNGKCTRAQIVTMLWADAGKPEANGNPFLDVAPNAWYAEAVSWAYSEGITTGTGTERFSPNESCSRAQIVTMLWRANGSPETSAQTRFADLSGSEWYAEAVRWAAENGITAGKRDDLFAASDTCTRAEAVTFLWRADGWEE